METTGPSKHYQRVIIHHAPAWTPGQFFYATDTEIVDAEVAPTVSHGLVQVSGTQEVYELAPPPGATYDYVRYHFMPRFPFVRREKKSMPMQEAIDLRLVDVIFSAV